MKTLKLFISLALISYSYSSIEACSTFSEVDKEGHTWVGKSFDYHSGAGKAFLNLRGVKKTSFISRIINQVSWTSKYSSFTFNQIHEAPIRTTLFLTSSLITLFNFVINYKLKPHNCNITN